MKQIKLWMLAAILATAFHPELDNDPRLHQYFLNSIKSPTRDRPQ